MPHIYDVAIIYALYRDHVWKHYKLNQMDCDYIPHAHPYSKIILNKKSFWLIYKHALIVMSVYWDTCRHRNRQLEQIMHRPIYTFYSK